MAAFGAAALAGGASVTTITTGNINVTGTDLALVIGAAEDAPGSPTITTVFDPTGTNQSVTSAFATLTSIGGYLNSTLRYLDNPTAANAPVRVTFSATVDGGTVGGAFFTAAADIVGTDQNSTSATTGTSFSITVPNVVSGDMVVDWLCFDPGGEPGSPATVGASQTDRGDTGTQADQYLRSHISTQAGADGGVMSWTFPNIRYAGGLIAGRIPDAGGGGGGGTLPNFLTTLGVG